MSAAREFSAVACLACDPFAGDFGGSGDSDRVLSDKVVVCRKKRKCHICAGFTKPRTRIRSRAEVYDGALMRFAWCIDCCAAMAAYQGEQDSELEQRYATGERRRMSPAMRALIAELDNPNPSPSTVTGGAL